jgi:hypothetical protein
MSKIIPPAPVITLVAIYYLADGPVDTPQWAVRVGTQKPPRDFVLAYIVSSGYESWGSSPWNNRITCVEGFLPRLPDEIRAAANAAYWINQAINGDLFGVVYPDADQSVAAHVAEAIQNDHSSTWPPVATAVANALHHHSVTLLEAHKEMCSTLLELSPRLAVHLNGAVNMNEEQLDFWSSLDSVAFSK